jgi:type I restriction enzyme M protein
MPPKSSKTVNSSSSTQNDVFALLWKVCDNFRGGADLAESVRYVLTLLFVKYLSDVQRDRLELGQTHFQEGDHIHRQEPDEVFQLPSGSSYYEIYDQLAAPNLGEVINAALGKIEDANRKKLDGVFRNTDFNSEAILGGRTERNRRLRDLLSDLNDPRLELRPSHTGNWQLVGDAYVYLLGKFAAGAGRRAGEFYTPPEVSELLVRMADPKPGDTIYDPACGTGTLLIKCALLIGNDAYFLYGQEINSSTWAIAKMNMVLHSIASARLELGDTLRQPSLVENDRLMKFNVVVANPPFSVRRWGWEEWQNDSYGQTTIGLPPKNNGDFAWLLHILATLDPSSGRAAVVVPYGVLFREGTEGSIRRKILESDLLEVVVSLGAKMLYGTSVPITLLLFRANKPTARRGKVLFVNASDLFEESGLGHTLRKSDISQITDWIREFRNVPGAVKVATIADIASRGWNLNTSRFVKPTPGQLLEHAVTSIRLGLDDFRTGEDDRVFSSVRNLYAGTLLLFKEKMLRLSPDDSNEVLLKVNVVPVMAGGRVGFKGDGTKTVDMYQIKERFEALGVTVDWQRIQRIQRKRNEIEHYYTIDKRSAIRDVLSNTFVVISEFIRDQLQEDPIELLGAGHWNIMLQAAELYKREHQRSLDGLRRVTWRNSKLEQYVDELRCPNCSSPLLEPAEPIESNIRRQYFVCNSCGRPVSYPELEELLLTSEVKEDISGETPSQNSISI